MEDRRAAASICSRHAHPGHPRQSMVRRRSSEAPSCLRVVRCLSLTSGLVSFRKCRIETKQGVPKLSIHSKFG